MSSLFSRGRTMIERILWPNVSTGDDLAPEVVTVYIHKAGDKFTKLESVTAFRRAVRQDLLTLEEAEVSAVPSTIHLRASTMPAGTVISQGCKIVDAAGATWMVVTANLETLDTRWRCIVNRSPISAVTT